jgi:hypothetical protein
MVAAVVVAAERTQADYVRRSCYQPVNGIPMIEDLSVIITVWICMSLLTLT